MSIIIQKMQELKGTTKHIEIRLWDRWNHDKLKAKLEEIGTTAFNRSYRQIALSEEDKTFRYFNKIIKDFDITLMDKTEWLYYGGVDLSGTKRKGNVFVTVAYNFQTNEKVIIDIIREKEHGIFAEKIIAQYDFFRHEIILVEDNGVQSIFIELLDQVNSNIHPTVKNFTTTRNKNSLEAGLPALAVEFEQDKWILPKSKIEDHEVTCKCNFCQLVSEFTSHPHGSIDDCVMATFFCFRAIKDYMVSDFYFVVEPDYDEYGNPINLFKF